MTLNYKELLTRRIHNLVASKVVKKLTKPKQVGKSFQVNLKSKKTLSVQ
jgi:hypothetical protein